jgi:exonuclease VII small subunit
MMTRDDLIGHLTPEEYLPPLYALAGEMLDVHDMLVENGGELTEDLEKMLDNTTGRYEEKVQRICRVIESMEAEAQTLDAQARAVYEAGEKIARRSEARLKAAGNLKRYLLTVLQRTHHKSLTAGEYRVTIRSATQPKVTTAKSLDLAALAGSSDRSLVRTESKLVLDKKEAIARFLRGEELPEGIEVTVTEYLQIK